MYCIHIHVHILHTSTYTCRCIYFTLICIVGYLFVLIENDYVNTCLKCILALILRISTYKILVAE